MTLDTEHGSRTHLLRIGDVARRTGKTVRAIHLYEELGLLQPATRSSGGFRLYEPGAVERVHWIELLHGLGFSLTDMREVLQRWWGADRGPAAMAELRALFARKLDETRAAVRRFQQLERELVDGLHYLETCRVCCEPGSVDTCVSCRQDHGVAAEPALVSGLKGEPARRGARPLVRIEDVVR
ncbi:MAG TPA: MerR family transcriptional regulator [Candidatus Eisenbacteria bacterium]|nr:MerR family transcriptional regulator [Candidatus Eisenbacteria bacterium]